MSAHLSCRFLILSITVMKRCPGKKITDSRFYFPYHERIFPCQHFLFLDSVTAYYSWVYIIHQILIQHILVFSFLLEKSSMDGVYVLFILVEHHFSLFFYFYILEELYLMVPTFIIQILGFQELFSSSS
jgi:hypothetical protein